MKNQTAVLILLAALLLAGCSGKTATPVPTVTPSLSEMARQEGTPIAAQVKEQVQSVPTPTPLPGEQAAEYRGLLVNVGKYELTGTYVNQFNIKRDPTGGRQFLWVQVFVTNTYTAAVSTPSSSHFSALFQGQEYKPSYGRRQGLPEYIDMKSTLFTEERLEGWLRFEVPAEAHAGELLFAYLPESIAVSFPSVDAPVPWANHPIYLWVLSGE